MPKQDGEIVIHHHHHSSSPSLSNEDDDTEDNDDDDDKEPSEFLKHRNKNANKALPNQQNQHQTEISGSLEGPINPVNYSGTQINVWGFPGGASSDQLTSLLLQQDAKSKEEQLKLGPLTDEMIKVSGG